MRLASACSAIHEPSTPAKLSHDLPIVARHAVVSRRGTLVLITGITGCQWAPAAPAAGRAGEDALYAVGEQYSNLNACALNSSACVSTQNDDEKHFIPPWQYEGPQAAAKDRLISIATGGQEAAFPPEEAPDEPRISRARVPGFQMTSGQALPQRPPRQRAASAVRFDGQVADAHTTEDGSEYVHVVFGANSKDPAGVIDAEFLFLSGDNVVDLRAAARRSPGLRAGMLGLSFSEGLSYDQNTAKRRMELLRKALRWEQAPVITDFDVRFNSRRLLWFEKLYQPFLPPSLRVDEEPIYDK